MATTELSQDYTERRSQEHTVAIIINHTSINDASIKVCPHELHVCKGDSVKWVCDENGTFTCEFPHCSPFRVKVIRGVKASLPETVTAGPGKYHYLCSYTDSHSTMCIDPVIIVDPSIVNTSKKSGK